MAYEGLKKAGREIGLAFFALPYGLYDIVKHYPDVGFTEQELGEAFDRVILRKPRNGKPILEEAD